MARNSTDSATQSATHSTNHFSAHFSAHFSTRYPKALLLLSVLLSLAYTWFLAGWVKFADSGYKEAFVGRFAETIFDVFPGSVALSMYFIGGIELLAFGLVVVSLFKLEFLRMDFFWFRWALALSAFCFAILGFGLRVIRDFQGSASLFFYMGVILVCFLLLEKFEKTKETNGHRIK